MLLGMGNPGISFPKLVSDRVMAYVTAEYMDLSMDESRASKILGLLSVQCLSDEIQRLQSELESCEPQLRPRLQTVKMFFETTNCPALQSSRRRLLEIVQKMVREDSRP